MSFDTPAYIFGAKGIALLEITRNVLGKICSVLVKICSVVVMASRATASCAMRGGGAKKTAYCLEDIGNNVIFAAKIQIHQ